MDLAPAINAIAILVLRVPIADALRVPKLKVLSVMDTEPARVTVLVYAKTNLAGMHAT